MVRDIKDIWCVRISSGCGSLVIIVALAVCILAAAGCSSTAAAPATVPGDLGIDRPVNLPHGVVIPVSREVAADSLCSRSEFMTYTGSRVPCDPVNVALVATPGELSEAFASMGWCQSSKTNLLSSLAMVACVALNLPYNRAPVSKLYLNGRPQDFCFEQVEGSPRRRHHIRLWRSGQLAPDGRPIWLGAATHDCGLKPCLRGLVMHRIDPNLAAERDAVMQALHASGWLHASSTLGLSAVLYGKNATGDRYFTDGRIILGFLTQASLAKKV